MLFKVLLVVLFMFLTIFSKDICGKMIEINMQTTKNISFCDGNTDTIVLKNPFPQLSGDYKTVVSQRDFVSASWNVYKTGQPEKILIEYSDLNQIIGTNEANIQAYDTWGLQITSGSPKDSGNYSIHYLTTRVDKNPLYFTYITFNVPPKLKSEVLSLSEENMADGSTLFKCGQIEDLGQPPVKILIKTEDGTILNSTFKDGFQITTVRNKNDLGKVMCDVDSQSESFKCISDRDDPRWEGIRIDKNPTEADSNFLLYVIIGPLALIGIVAIIVIIVIMVRKRKAGKKYNARKEEKMTKVEEGKSPLVSDLPPETSSNNSSKRTPIYKGPSSQSPATRHSYPRYEQNGQEDYEEYEMNGRKKTPKPSTPPPTAPKYRKKSEPIIETREGGVRPPEKKPRSIFLTPSMEELDKINEAVRGGKGSQPGTMV